MAERPRVRSYKIGEEAEIIELLTLAFNGWPRIDLDYTPHEHWIWKFLDNPLKKSFITVCEHDKKIVACEHEFLIKIRIGKSKLLCTYSSDQAVHPNYRGMGLSNAMVEYSSEQRRKYGCDFGYWITSNPIMIRSYQKHWPSFPHRVINLVKIQDIGLQIHKMPMKNPWFMRVGYLFLKYVNKIKNLLKNYDSHNELTISKVDTFDDRVNEFWAKIQHNYDFIVERTKEYLNWRYCDPRAGEYQIMIAEKDSELVGYCVFTINNYNPEYPVGYIVELLTLPGESEAATKLLREAVNYFDNNEVNIINCLTVKSHIVNRILSKQGFLDSRMPVYVFTYTIDFEEEYNKIQGFDRNRVYISYGDLDSLPVNI